VASNGPYDEFYRLWDQKNYPQAESYLTDIIDEGPSDWQAYRLRAWARSEQNNYQGAMEDATSALTINRRDIWMLDILGDSLAKLGRGQDAIPIMSEAIDLNPTNTETYVLRSQVWRVLGQEKKRLADLHTALGIVQNDIGTHPMNANSYALRADIWDALGRHKEKLEDLATAAQLDPKDFNRYYRNALNNQN
jgi:tetratricopeptide (TPR) repeat protein